MSAYPNLLQRIDSRGTPVDNFGSPIQQSTPSGGFGETNMPSPYVVSGGMSTNSLQQGIGSLLGIIDQNINQNPQTARLMNLRQMLMDFNQNYSFPSSGQYRGARPAMQSMGIASYNPFIFQGK